VPPSVTTLRRAALVLLLPLTAVACGDRGTAEPPAPQAPRLVALWIAGGEGAERPAVDTLEARPNAGYPRRARGRMSDGRLVDVVARWSTSDASVAALGDTLAPITDLYARARGQATLTARVDGLTASQTIVVPPLVLVEARILRAGDSWAGTPYAGPRPDTLMASGARRYVVQCFTRYAGEALPERLLWRSTDPSRATVDATGLVTAHALGTVGLVATCAGATGEEVSAELPLRVRGPLAARIAFTYAPESLFLHRTDSLRAVLLDSAGAPMEVPVRFHAEGGAAIDGATIRANLAGPVTLEASGDGLVARRTLRVLPGPAGSARILPAALTLVEGTRAPLLPDARDFVGPPLGVAPTTTYTSVDAAIAVAVAQPAGSGFPPAVAAGIVSAVAPGRTSIRLTQGTVTADVPVTVVARGAFRFDLRPARAAPIPTAYELELYAAMRRWETAVVGDLPDVRMTLPVGACGVDMPRLEELAVDDVLLLADVVAIDGPGGALAGAGPCVVREDGTTIVGVIEVDVADVPLLGNDSRLARQLFAHEIGHVLGFGTTWGLREDELVVTSSPFSRYRGARGLYVGTWWSVATTGAAPGVPLGDANYENIGTGHWSEAALGTELMTPYLNVGENPLSLLTLEALGDMGYQTSAAGADPFKSYPPAWWTGAAPSLSRAPAPVAPHAAARQDRVLAPRWRLGRDGQLRRIAPERAPSAP